MEPSGIADPQASQMFLKLSMVGSEAERVNARRDCLNERFGVPQPIFLGHMEILGIDAASLPIVWDADFLYGPRTALIRPKFP